MSIYNYIHEKGKINNIPVFGMEQFNNKQVPINVWLIKNDNLLSRVHAHEYIQIYYTRKGGYKHIVGDEETLMVKGDIFVIQPMIPHCLKAIDDNEVEIIECEFMPFFLDGGPDDFTQNRGIFDFSCVEPFLVSNDYMKPGKKISGKAQQDIEQILLEMIDEYKKKEQGYELFLKADILRLAILLNRELNESSRTNPAEHMVIDKYRDAVLNSLKYINENYNKDIKLEFACKLAMMSQAYFCNIFKQLTGKTFVEYVNDLRIQKSMDLLCSGNERITDICYDVGFHDIIHFNRVFKKEVGISPSMYRKIKVQNDNEYDYRG
jgi:AraC-type DNA-binding domain-containing proteins